MQALCIFLNDTCADLHFSVTLVVLENCKYKVLESGFQNGLKACLQLKQVV